jgi:hypothetical protein
VRVCRLRVAEIALDLSTGKNTGPRAAAGTERGRLYYNEFVTRNTRPGVRDAFGACALVMSSTVCRNADAFVQEDPRRPGAGPV